uniref:Lipase n=1 Tax=Amblyomma maculatum TaxID=34609 RepID=G3MRU5_AMBMU
MGARSGRSASGPFALFVLATVALSVASAEDELVLQARLSPCELIKYHGYPCEISYATTDDGYVLEVDRIPHGRSVNASAESTTPRYPILLLPVFCSAADVWFLNYPSQTPGFLFADAGFDVWAMNSREARPYSKHKTLSQKDPKYWRWSFDDIGRYDVAATIDHVLKVTGAPKLTLVALSQGAVTTLVLLSSRPEYNDKVDLVIAYGPVANLTHAGPPLSLALPILPPVLRALDPFSRGAYLGASDGLQRVFTRLCEVVTGQVCSVVVTLSLFSSPHQLNETRMPVYAGHWPVGTTIQNMRHYYQVYRAQNFVMYDHGAMENMWRYGQRTPPPYPLERITSPYAIFSSEGDLVADTQDVANLVARLGETAILHRVVPQKTLRHLDFALGYNANDFLHDVAIDLIRKHASQYP